MSSASLIDGKKIAETVTDELAIHVSSLKAQHGIGPGLAVVLVGTRKDSATYVRNKKKMCEKVGIVSYGYDLPENVKEVELLALIDELNKDDKVHGILVQLPLPSHIKEANVIARIAPSKDVDGLTTFNVGSLCQHGPEKSPLISCTPAGCIELLKRSNITISGKNAVVIGRSNIVGKPMVQLLIALNATVTVCHSKTADIAQFTRNADIVVVAIGKANFVKGDWLKPGATVIDVGINAIDDSSAKTGYRLVGDCEFESCKAVAGHITPVPGGVGPMTIAMLMSNTVKAFETVQKGV